MTATTTVQYEEIELQKMTIAKLLDLARDNYNLALPKSWNKGELINAIQQAQSGEDLSTYIVKPADQPPAPAIVETPPTPAELTEIQAKLEEYKEQLSAEEAARLQKEAEKSKAKKAKVDPTVDQLCSFANDFGYAIGAALWPRGRMKKSGNRVTEVAEALGEGMDADAYALATDAMIQGFTRAHKQMRFFCEPFEKLFKGAALSAAIIQLIRNEVDDNPVLDLGTLPSVSIAEDDGFSEPDDTLPENGDTDDE